MTSTTSSLVATGSFTLDDGRTVDLEVDSAPSPAEFVVRARDETGVVVGLATCNPDGRHAGVAVCVAPGWRRARLGTALLRHAVDEAAQRDIAWLVLHFADGESGLSSWLKESGLVIARRVSNGMVRVAVLVPGALERTEHAA